MNNNNNNRNDDKPKLPNKLPANQRQKMSLLITSKNVETTLTSSSSPPTTTNKDESYLNPRDENNVTFNTTNSSITAFTNYLNEQDSFVYNENYFEISTMSSIETKRDHLFIQFPEESIINESINNNVQNEACCSKKEAQNNKRQTNEYLIVINDTKKALIGKIKLIDMNH
jgi:hypothetical protein